MVAVSGSGPGGGTGGEGVRNLWINLWRTGNGASTTGTGGTGLANGNG